MTEHVKKSSVVSLMIPAAIILCLIIVLFEVKKPRPRHGSAPNACMYNLRMLNAAIVQWAKDNNKQPNDAVTSSDISSYLKVKYICPSGTNYTVGPVISNGVTCPWPPHQG